MNASALSAVTAAAPSAGGAPIDQLAVLAFIYGGGTAAVMWLAWSVHNGRAQWLSQAATAAGWIFRMPGWVGLPVLLGAVSLLLTMGGGYWDIGYHIDYGRDTGPLGNPAHYPMLFGFFGSFSAGVLCLGLADQRHATKAWVQIAKGWRVPVGGLVMVACSAFGLIALSLDDVWHRIFGQDVTLWSPTHFMLLGGATFTVIGMSALIADAAGLRKRTEPTGPLANGSGNGNGEAPLLRVEFFRRDAKVTKLELTRGRSVFSIVGYLWGRIQRVALLGGMLVGFEAFLAEYDWGLPLYRQVWQPLILAGASAFVYVAARAWTGRGGAFSAWIVYAAVRAVASLFPVLAGRSQSIMPLLLAGALCVELVAFVVDTRRKPIMFGAVAGTIAGVVGFFGEYFWSQLAMPLPWTSAMIPEGIVVATLAGLAGGVLGGLLGSSLRAELPRKAVARTACVGAFAVLIALGINSGLREVPDGTVKFTLETVQPEPKRTALATVRLSPADIADDANWFYILAWQGGPGTKRIVDRLERIGAGVYRSTKPIPLYGRWKSGLRLHSGYQRGAAPIRLPADEALAGSDQQLPASFTSEVGESMIRATAGAELKAPASFSRPFLDDGTIVLREAKSDVPSWLWALAIAVIGGFYVLFIFGIAVGVARLTRRGMDPIETATADDLPLNATVDPSLPRRGAALRSSV